MKIKDSKKSDENQGFPKNQMKIKDYKEIIEKYNLSTCVKMYEDLYSEVISDNQS